MVIKSFFNRLPVVIIDYFARIWIGYICMVHSTYANILKYIYKKVRKIVGTGWIG